MGSFRGSGLRGCGRGGRARGQVPTAQQPYHAGKDITRRVVGGLQLPLPQAEIGLHLGDAAFGPPPARLRACALVSPTPPQGGSDCSCSSQGFSYSPQIIPPLNASQTALQTLEYHSPLEGESQKPEPNGEGFCGGGFAQGEPTARSCAPSRVRIGQVTSEGFCGGGIRAVGTCRAAADPSLPCGILALQPARGRG